MDDHNVMIILTIIIIIIITSIILCCQWDLPVVSPPAFGFPSFVPSHCDVFFWTASKVNLHHIFSPIQPTSPGPPLLIPIPLLCWFLQGWHPILKIHPFPGHFAFWYLFDPCFWSYFMIPATISSQVFPRWCRIPSLGQWFQNWPFEICWSNFSLKSPIFLSPLSHFASESPCEYPLYSCEKRTHLLNH